MCFSAEASFTGAAVIGVWGLATIPLVKSAREVPFAALPLAFAVHQVLEGLTWLELGGAASAVLDGWGVQYWILFAWALLPIWIPVAVWLIEPLPFRRRQLVPLMLVGSALAIFMAVAVVRTGVEVQVRGHSLDYELPYRSAWMLAIPYVMATCLAPVLSSWRYVRWFGVGNLIALSASVIIEASAFTSVWCTFAAFLSALVFWHFFSTRGVRSRPHPLGPAAV